jgi:hypothetical protein
MLQELSPEIREKIAVCPFSGCWCWLGAKTPKGYGTVYADGKDWKAHRYIYEKIRGPIPPKHVLDHLLKDRPIDPGPCVHGAECVNPYHVQPVTVEINSKRVRPWNKDKDACPAGHLYAEHGHEYQCSDGYKRRFCRACRKGRK